MYAIVDIETTGGNARFEKITEIAICIHDGEKIVQEFSTLVNPEKSIPPFITRLTGISNDMVEGAPRFFEIAKSIVEITEGKTLVAHNAHFDYGFIREEFRNLGFHFHRDILCTVRLSRKLIPGFRSYSLGNICEELGISNEARHRAAGDAMATTKLFEMLLTKDRDAIQKSIKSDISLMKLPPNLDKGDLDKLPEETGVYYFHNERGNIIYIGKSNNIRKRALTHFAEKENTKTLAMKADIHSITYEVTGSELVALLLESDEIKKHKPLYNRQQRESYFQWGIFKNIDENGYFTLKASRIKGHDDNDPLMTARNMEEARGIIDEQVEKYNLCQKLCSVYDIKHACFRHHVNQCKGACIGKESPEDYNKRVIQLIRKWRYQNQNFFILGEGRNRNEQSVVAIEKGRYIGFGFMDTEFAATSPDQLKFFIKNYNDNRDVQRIIQRHLRKAPSHTLITY